MGLKRIESANDMAVKSTEVVNASPKPKRARLGGGDDDDADAKRKEAKMQKRAAEAAAGPASSAESGTSGSGEEISIEHGSKPLAKVDDFEAARTFMQANEITIHSAEHQSPCTSLAAAPFPAPLVQLLMQQGFSMPSAVQGASWPIAMAGKDVLAIAKTGSGKTLGYLLPALSRAQLHWEKAAGKPLCLVMAPTRELALQIKGEATKFGAPLQIRAVAVYGGDPKWKQISELSRGAEILIATPGRMMDMLDLHGTSYGGAATSLEMCSMLVLDEADRMLDMGFEKDIRAIVAKMPEGRQTFLFTATWPKAVQRVAADLLGPSQVKVTVGSGGDKLTANKAVVQHVRLVQPAAKWEAFVELLAPYKAGGAAVGTRVIIFANTKRDVNAIGQYCWDHQLPVDTLSGDRTQRERESVIERFRAGQLTMVIATDVAARGLDINGIGHVINYDYPPGDGGSEDYIHRIGRTGRAGATGVADTLFTNGDSKHARELVRILSDAGQVVPAELSMMAQRGGGGKQWW